MEASGIGFSLEMAHATAVVRHHNGSYQNIACIETNRHHKEKMAGLIQAGNKPVFDNSAIEALGNTVQQLRRAVENAGVDVVVAAITLPDQIGLQYDEATAILSHADIRNVMYDPPIGTRGNFQELTTISAAYAGLGMGLCSDYLDFDKCDSQEACLPVHHVLQIDLSTETLTGTTWQSADTYWFPMIADTFVNIALGTNVVRSPSGEQEYWQAVCQAIRTLLMSFVPDRVDFLVLTGSSVEHFADPLRSAVRAAMVDTGYEVDLGSGHHINQVLQADYVVHEPIWMTARGAAEIAKRRQERPFMCRYDNRTEKEKRPLRDLIKEWRADGITEL